MASESNHSTYNLEAAWELACAGLRETDIEEQCRRSGATYESGEAGATITVSFLNQRYRVTVPEISVSAFDGAGEPPLRERVLILHYLSRARGTAATDRFITFRELPGGVVYYPTFTKRTTEPLLGHFGKAPDRLVEAGRRLGGRDSDAGDTAIVIDAFSRVPLTLVLWEGDDELPAQLNLLFDANITDYLETEDVTILCETLTWRLIRGSRQDQSQQGDKKPFRPSP